LVSGQEVLLAYIQDLIIKPPFSELFSIDENVLQGIVKNILENTYDESQPIVVWKDKNIVIDGHTRLKASHLAGRQIISVFNKAFRNEEEALQYAINNQRNRRNMSEAELLRCIEAVDKRQERGEAQERVRGKFQPKAQSCANGKSSEQTAKVVGVSARKVEQARSIISDPEEKEAVITGKKSINKASQDAKAKRKSKPTEPIGTKEDRHQTVLLQAWAELQAWRRKYRDYIELAPIFAVVDREEGP
jgi:ParB-like chromosome segregation protein Spo0J